MSVQWTDKAVADLVRLHEFLAPVNPGAAARVIQSLTAAVRRLPEHPRIGEKIEHYAPREVRRILAGTYEIRYEIRDLTVTILRLWHTREGR